MYEFEYLESAKEYRERNNVVNKIEKVELKDNRQLKNKFPRFLIKLSSEHGVQETIVITRRLSNGTFRVVSGWGQLSFGIIKEN